MIVAVPKILSYCVLPILPLTLIPVLELFAI